MAQATAGNEVELICIVCPKGCTLKIAAAGNAGVTATDVQGSGCARGRIYAVKELTNPERTLTTTVRLVCRTTEGTGQRMAPVRSAGPLPKALVPDCMKVINSIAVKAPLKVGDVIIPNIMDTGVDIISTANIPGEV